MTLSRRELLGASACLPMLGALPGGWWLPGADSADRQLVVIQLTGGLDGLSSVVPHADDDYHRARPRLGLGPSRLVPLDDSTSLARPLDGLMPAWDAGQLAIVRGVGCPEPNRSHFKSMDIWHTARRDGRPDAGGWLGRLADRLGADGTALPVARVGRRDLPLALTGASPQVPAVASLSDLGLDGDRDLARLERLADPRAGRASQAARVARSLSAALHCARQLSALRAAEGQRRRAADGSLGHALRTAAQLLTAPLGTRVLYLTQIGYDTHARQADLLPALQRELADGLAAFWQEVVQRGDAERVLVLVFSEFGRRIHENASGGTDHGAGNPLFLLGGGVRGGLHGEAPRLDGPLDGDVPVTLDFRRVYADVLAWLGHDPASVLPEPRPRLGLLG